jgi:hypothetical protein
MSSLFEKSVCPKLSDNDVSRLKENVCRFANANLHLSLAPNDFMYERHETEYGGETCTLESVDVDTNVACFFRHLTVLARCRIENGLFRARVDWYYDTFESSGHCVQVGIIDIDPHTMKEVKSWVFSHK